MVLSSELTYISIKAVSCLFFNITVQCLVPYPLIVREYPSVFDGTRPLNKLHKQQILATAVDMYTDTHR